VHKGIELDSNIADRRGLHVIHLCLCHRVKLVEDIELFPVKSFMI
jgi:hypothetical protein